MKKLLSLLPFLIITMPSFGDTVCMCDEEGGGTWTTTTYFTEGGCCSGIPSTGGIQHNYIENEGAYALSGKRNITGDEAQSICCP